MQRLHLYLLPIALPDSEGLSCIRVRVVLLTYSGLRGAGLAAVAAVLMEFLLLDLSLNCILGPAGKLDQYAHSRRVEFAKRCTMRKGECERHPKLYGFIFFTSEKV